MMCVGAGLLGVAGCSPSEHPSKATSSSPPASAVAGPGPVGSVGTSPSGVTTRVEAPADSTEEEYFQACHAAKTWMDAQAPREGAAQALIEPYLAMVQASASGTAGSWNVRWPDLTPARQAAVIIAAHAAANAECG